MSKSFRFGILGVAKINERIIPAFGQAKLAEVSAIASRSAEKATEAAVAAGIPRSFGSYDALLSDDQIDAVYIPLPNSLHAAWVRKAADQGKHILCEKPLCPNAAEAQELVEYCERKGVLLMDGFMWPHHPRTAELRRFLDSGALGSVPRANACFSFQLDLSQKNIRLDASAGGGSLLDVGCYPVYGIRWAMRAEPVRVFATARFEAGVDVAMDAILWFADGRMASFDTSFVHPLRQWLEITCDEGSVLVPEMWLPGKLATFEVRRGWKVDVHASEGHDQIAKMLDDFSEAALDRKPVEPGPDEAVKTLRVVDALARSAREGRVVEV